MEQPPAFAQNAHGFPRIQPEAFSVVIFCGLGVAIATATFRTALRVYKFGKLEWDDAFLISAVVFLSGAVGLYQVERDDVYLEVNAILGVQIPPSDFSERLLMFQKLNTAATILVWLSIFCIKLSFVMFFRKLVSRVRILELWWRVVLGVLVVLGPITIFMVFIICPDFSSDFRVVCGDVGMTVRERDYTIFATIIDILTDLMIISIPITLLWRVKIDIRRKLALGVVLCLSAFMIIIAIIRVGLSQVYSNLVQSDITDTVWLIFWQAIEASTAIIMVSITAFRALLGQDPSSRGYQAAPTPLGGGSGAGTGGIGGSNYRSSHVASTKNASECHHMEKVGKLPPSAAAALSNHHHRSSRNGKGSTSSSADDLVEVVEVVRTSPKASGPGYPPQPVPETFV